MSVDVKYRLTPGKGTVTTMGNAMINDKNAFFDKA